ncbi:mCG1028355, partial [Mus musculus]
RNTPGDSPGSKTSPLASSCCSHSRPKASQPVEKPHVWTRRLSEGEGWGPVIRTSALRADGSPGTRC